jgi:methylamine dehydrogenase heavy chain
MATRSPVRAASLLLAVLALAPGRPAAAFDALGQITALPADAGPHWVWLSDVLLRRSALIDGDSGRFLGMVGAGWGIIAPHVSPDRREIYLAETHYSRGTRGERTDVVTVYDATTLQPAAEVVIPPKRSDHVFGLAGSALSDDGRFLAVFNLTPATSLSIVDLAARSFAAEIDTPGCSLVYAAGTRRFLMLCGDGAALVVEVDESGREAARARTAPFFDPKTDPVTEKAVRRGDEWLFVSFEGFLHAVDVSGPELRFAEPWDLFTAEERAESWRIGGHQHLAVHARSGRLYALVHRGPPDTHKEPGEEIFVYDLAARRRVQRIELASPGLTYLGAPIEPGPRLFWPLRPLFELALSLVGLGVDGFAVTQDDAPLLVTGSEFSGSLAVHDAGTGELLRRVAPGNMTTVGLRVPWETVEAAR